MPSKVQKRSQPPPSRRLYGSIREVLDTVDPQNYTVQHIELALNGLKPDLVPDRYGEKWDSNVEAAAIACLGFVLQAGALCHMKPPTFKEALVNGIITVREGICGWIKLLVEDEPSGVAPEEMRKRALSSAKSLTMLVSIDPRVAYAFMETPAFVDCLCILWTTQDPTESRELSFIIDLDAEEDSILGAIRRFVYIFKARDALIDAIVSTNVILFAAAMTGRAVTLRDIVRAGGYRPAVLSYVKHLVDFLGRIMTSDNAELRWALVESEYLVQFGGLLYDLAVTLKRSPRYRKSLKDLAEPVYYITIILSREKSRVAQNWADLAKAKFEATISFVTTGLVPRDIEQKNQVTEALLGLGAYTVFPRVLKRLVEARSDLDTDELIKAQDTTDVGIHWKEFWISTNRRGELHEKWSELDDFSTCDNPSCDGTNRVLGSTSQQCSRCSSVVYCSEHCQRLDWIRQHHSECTHARKDHFDQRDAGAWYSHTSRAYHLRHLETLYTTHFDQVEKARNGAPPNTYISTIDCTTAKDRIAIYRVKNKDKPETVWTTVGLEFRQEYLSPRLRALAEEFLSGSMDSDMRLAEGVFPHGPDEEIYLPVLFKKMADKFEAIYSIPRRGVKIKGDGSESGSGSDV